VLSSIVFVSQLQSVIFPPAVCSIVAMSSKQHARTRNLPRTICTNYGKTLMRILIT